MTRALGTCGMDAIEALAVVDNADQLLEIGWLESVCRDIEAAPRTVEAIREIAARNPERVSFGALRRKFYAWRRFGTAGLVDRRKLKKLNGVNPWAECYQQYCESHDRSNKGAWRAMITDFQAGEALPCGVGSWREWWRAERPHAPAPEGGCPEGFIPRCARYEQIVASRRGRKAMHPYLLPVLKTRVGLEPGQVYEFDDVDTDAEVVMPGIGKTARVVMFVGYDLSSGYRVSSATRPEYASGESTRKDSLKEKEFRFMVADLLTNKGFHRDGVRMVVEHGTAAIREAVEKRIKCIPIYGDKIEIARSGILAEAVHAGYFKGDGGGNFRFKAYCEQMHRVEHSERAMLPGQIGQDADHRPESHAALARYNRQLMEAVGATLSGQQRDMIRYSLMEYSEMCRVIEELADRIADRRDHALEGWEDKRVRMWRMDESMPWQPWEMIEQMPEDKRAAVMAFLSVNRQLVGSLPMSRREAWTAGAGALIRVPLINLPLLLDERDAYDVRVAQDGTFGFSDKFYWGRDKRHYHATCTNRAGFQQRLQPGRTYMFFTTPYHQDGVVVDRESGDILGVAPFYNRAPIYDRQAVIEAAGAQNHDLARKLMPVRGRHQQEAEARLELIGHNADVLAGRKLPPLPQIETTATIDDLYEAAPVAADDW